MKKIIFKQILRVFFGYTKTSELVLENLALRQQLAIMKRSIQRPRIRNRDRLFWVLLSHIWSNKREGLIVVKPEAVVRWHRKGFKLFWKIKSRHKGKGRPSINFEIRELVQKMAKANPRYYTLLPICEMKHPPGTKADSKHPPIYCVEP